MQRGYGPPPPPEVKPLVLAVWLWRPLALCTTRIDTAGRRWARDVKTAVISLLVLALWAELGQSQILAWFLAVAAVATAAHAARPAPEGHTFSLGLSLLGGHSGRPAAGRTAEAVLAILGGLWAGECGDFAARSYFVASGSAGLLVLGAVAKRERDLKDNLSDGAYEARARHF